jgi:hypothetical protein
MIASMTTSKRLRVIDRRTTWARRHRELAGAFASDLGPRLSAADYCLADHAASVFVECERLKGRQLNDEAIDVDELVRLTNAATRIRIELGKRAKPADEADWAEMQEEADRIEREQRDAAP